MHYSDKLTLITKTKTMDDTGQPVASTSSRIVWADIRSVSRAEYFAAAQTGLKPDVMVVVRQSDYLGETSAAIGGESFEIYRTYNRGSENVELYLKSKAGAK